MNGFKVAAAALGVVCIVLVAGFIWAYTYHTSIINDKNTTILNKDSQISDLQTWLDANRTEFQSYTSSHTHSNTEYDSLQSIANLGEQQTILSQNTINQGAGGRTLVASFQANYAGYLYVSLTSTTTNAYVIVEYWYQGRLFSFQKTLGTSGDALFCLLTSSVAVYAGNSNLLNGATHTITAIYHY